MQHIFFSVYFMTMAIQLPALRQIISPKISFTGQSSLCRFLSSHPQPKAVETHDTFPNATNNKRLLKKTHLEPNNALSFDSIPGPPRLPLIGSLLPFKLGEY